MKVLITISRGMTQRYLVDLVTKELIYEVRQLIDSEKHSKAITTVLSKGRLDRQLSDEDVKLVNADLILSETNSSWDLTD